MPVMASVTYASTTYPRRRSLEQRRGDALAADVLPARLAKLAVFYNSWANPLYKKHKRT